MRKILSPFRSLFLSLVLLTPLALPAPVQAAEPDPAIYLLIDTSGSMLMNISGSTKTWGDGSSEHAGVNGTTSRFYIAKEAIKSVLNSYGEVRWGMARFQQRSGLNYLCSCSSELPNNTAGCGGYGGLWSSFDSCRLCDMMQNYPDYDEPATHDRVCINYAGGILDGCRDPITNTALTGADILVTLGANNVANITKWINHAETDPGEAGYNGALAPGAQVDPELRATGGTPLGGSLQSIYNQLSATDIHADTLRGCRPYSVIVLTDGAESCSTNPVTVATSLRSIPDNLSTCSTNAQCPPNSWCNGGKCRYDVKTHVIAFAVAPNEYLNCHQIGVAGGAGGAISAQNQAELVAAMAEIIADSIVTELCNNLDDDCDGSADEDFPEKGLACDNGLLGACRGTGNYVCAADGTSTQCNITSPGVASSAEVCDGIDNNCNGLVDDGITCAGPTPELCNGIDDDSNPGTPDGADDPSVGLACGSSLGICEPGITICSGGTIMCQQDDPPGTETCNNLDDDCDGMTDEGLTSTCDNVNAFGTCSGLSYCSAGSWICTAAAANTETCNNFDDDCDGSIDEDLNRACELRNSFGVCSGTETCAAGVWGTCNATTPSQDICNGLDDNCDGAFDDDDPNVGLPCSSGCGTYICEDGALTCDGQAGSDEICDGLDNDCNGVPDDNLSQNCEITNEFGTCTGVELCLDGGWEGCSATTPRQEECNGIDDNCDGLTDNEAICPTPTDVCYEGACRKPCTEGEFTCKGTEECIVYPEDPEVSICMPLLQECGMQICTLTEVCVELECINPCEAEPCDVNETCTVNFRWREGDPVDSQYFCVDSSCATVGNFCPDGSFCWDSDCVTDPCVGMTCATLEYCTRVLDGEAWVGQCESVCNCRTGQRCTEEGTCETDPCFEKECDSGFVCIEGDCVSDACAEVACRQGEICVEGLCHWNPCYEVLCPAWAMCQVVAGDDEPSAVCKPKPENVTEEVIKGKVTVGGFGCSTSRDAGGSPDGVFWGLLLAAGLFITRKRRLGVQFLPVLLLVVFSLGACDRAVYTIKDDATINTDVNNTNDANNGNNQNNNNNNCTPTGEELCDGLDNDCNGTIDDPWTPAGEGGQGGFMTDPANCGVCGNICGFFHGEGLCVGGECALGDCDAYYFNNNDDSDDGCEYRCNTLGGSEELCDGLDNDCDGLSDEPWIPEAEGGEAGWLTDPENCGFCGISCEGRYAHAVGDCGDGRCFLDYCEAGWINANQIVADGCETQCIESNGGVEVCDGIDNDCDGRTDEDTSDLPLARPCYTGDAGTEGVGTCAGGTEYCSAGVWGPTCVGEILPRAETCDGADNDCDNSSDEIFDFNNDLNYCGSCTNSCLTSRPDNSYPIACSTGTCQYACSYGFHDINGDLNTLGMAGDGCEYACEPTASVGVEFCDGLDNDCDFAIDEVANLVAPPAGYCRTGGGCGAVVTSTCQLFSGTKQWVCNYPAAVERIITSPNQVNGFETLCDNLDGDCDGSSDDDFYPAKGSACVDSNLGICQGNGVYACKADFTGTECSITIPGAAPASELCDDIDNDCDGLTDEPAWNAGSNASYVQDSLVTISVGGQNVFMYKYEASRPTATAGSPGTGSEIRACSKAGVVPWSRVTYAQAQQACSAAGMDLCEENVWEEACNGSAVTRIYPYGDTYNTTNCWGVETGVTTAQITGSKAACTSSGYLAIDLSGNLREWVSEPIAYSADGKVIYQTRGGSFRDGSEALKCAHDTVALTEDAFSNNVGFRCCTRCGNGILDADETCDDGNRVSGDGCSAVCGPDTCGNGVLQGTEECDCGLNSGALPGGCIAINGAPNANCKLNCTIPEEQCSILYPEDQDRGSESSDCTDPFCSGTRCGDVSDNDGDGFTEPDDCNDGNASVHPAMDEVCGNGVDDNCNGQTDNAELDKDGDGVLRCVSGVTTDCNDWDPARYPGKPEVCSNGIDENCDGSDVTNCASACQIAEFSRSYIGCEYYSVPTMNHWLGATFDNNFGLVVHNPNSTATTVTVTRGATTIGTQNLAAGQIYTFLVAYNATLKTTITAPSQQAAVAYKVVSTQPVTVYQFNPFDFVIGGTNSYTNDASLLLPKHVMSRNYMVLARQTWMWNGTTPIPGFFAIVATEAGTTVEVTYNGHAYGGPNKGSVTNYTLGAGDVLQVPSRNCPTGGASFYCGVDYDLTGTKIRVTNATGHPVGVFAGHDCTNIWATQTACDHVEEMMFPLETWGKNFVATYTSPYTGTATVANVYRIVAAENSTVITYTPASVRAADTLQAGQYVEFESSVNFSISATKPIAAIQFMMGQDRFSGTSTGDPAMMLLVPMEQFRKNYTFTVPSSMTNNFVNIIKPVAQAGLNAPTLYFDGVAIPEASFSTAIGNTYFGVYRRTISTAPYNHTITSSQPFGILVYGHASYTSYMYPGGLDLNILNIVN